MISIFFGEDWECLFINKKSLYPYFDLLYFIFGARLTNSLARHFLLIIFLAFPVYRYLLAGAVNELAGATVSFQIHYFSREAVNNWFKWYLLYWSFSA